jgi:hypothetical protein
MGFLRRLFGSAPVEDTAAAWLVEVLNPLDENDRKVVVQALKVLRPLFATVAAPSGAHHSNVAV